MVKKSGQRSSILSQCTHLTDRRTLVRAGIPCSAEKMWLDLGNMSRFGCLPITQNVENQSENLTCIHFWFMALCCHTWPIIAPLLFRGGMGGGNLQHDGLVSHLKPRNCCHIFPTCPNSSCNVDCRLLSLLMTGYCSTVMHVVVKIRNIWYMWLLQILQMMKNGETTLDVSRWDQHILNPKTRDKAAIDWWLFQTYLTLQKAHLFWLMIAVACRDFWFLRHTMYKLVHLLA